jgi:single-stranded DNA-binding protein
LVCVEGSITTSQYEKNGEKRYSTQIICDRLEMLGGKSEPKQESVKVDMNNIDDDLPF